MDRSEVNLSMRGVPEARPGDGADDALAAAYRAHFSDLVRLARRLVDQPEVAEEAVQEVFANLARIGAPGGVPLTYAYLRAATVNQCRSVLRHRRVRRSWARVKEPSRYVPDHSVQQAEQDVIRAAVRALPERQREAVVLRYYEDLAINHIAVLLGISDNAVSVALSHARNTILHSLEHNR